MIKQKRCLDLLWATAIILLTVCGLIICQDICGSIGSDTRKFSGSERNAFYLNTARPALCNGSISQLNYCYYGFGNTSLVRHDATVAFYRPISDQHFMRVSDTITISISPLLSGFNCGSYGIDEDVLVQENDVIGVCVRSLDDGSRGALRLATSSLPNSESDGYFMMTSSVGDAGCTNGSMPDVLNTLVLDDTRRVLHVFADVGNFNTTKPGKLPTSKIGGIVGGVLGGALILVAVVTIVMIIIIVMWRRRAFHHSTSEASATASGATTVPKRYFRKKTLSLNSGRVAGTASPSGQNGTQVLLSSQDLLELSMSLGMEQNFYQNTTSSAVSQVVAMQAEREGMSESDEHFYFVLEGPKCPYAELLEKNKKEDIYASLTKYQEPATKVEDLYTQIKSFGIRNIERSAIDIQGHLGSGHFGSVKRGYWRTKNFEVEIALKTLGHRSTSKNRVKFLQEAATMAQFRHPNIISLFGVVSKQEPVMMVVELAEKGDLIKYLKLIKPNSNTSTKKPFDLPRKLLSFSQQIALGMQYLSGKGFVHRDLAARNILVSKDNLCKIADFGLSRDLANEKYYISHGGKVPVKWTAPEAIHYRKYSTASDVWSYGCLLYEIWSLGHPPFEHSANFEVLNQLERGIRLAPPPGCPRKIYEIMIHCWHPSTGSRPTFREVVVTLTGDESEILHVPKEVCDGHVFAGCLGSLLEAGENMYIDLQETYHV